MAFASTARLKLALGIAGGGIAIGFFLGRASATWEMAKSVDAKTARVPAAASIASHREQSSPGTQIDAGQSTPADWRQRWQALKAQPVTPASEEQMRACLSELGARDFATALQLAQAAATPRQRELFRNAALQGWATRDPQAAASWALSHVRTQERRTAVEAIAAGAVGRPDDAIRAFQRVIAGDPTMAGDHGNALASAFAQVGEFDLASDFAAAGPAQFRAAWLSNVYHAWATCQPQAALSGLDKISDSAARREAQDGLFAGWASSDPAGLVGYAQTLPIGESRLDALKEGLTQWVFRDSAAASHWMDNFDPSPDLDAGAAALAVMPALVEKKPDVAASWAESITDPELRASTLIDLIRLWAEHDAAGARKYVASSPALPAETRSLALSILDPSP